MNPESRAARKHVLLATVEDLKEVLENEDMAPEEKLQLAEEMIINVLYGLGDDEADE